MSTYTKQLEIQNKISSYNQNPVLFYYVTCIFINEKYFFKNFLFIKQLKSKEESEEREKILKYIFLLLITL